MTTKPFEVLRRPLGASKRLVAKSIAKFRSGLRTESHEPTISDDTTSLDSQEYRTGFRYRFKFDGDGLCTICSRTFTLVHAHIGPPGISRFKIDHQERDHYPQLPKLNARAENGCYMCGFIRTVIRENTCFWSERFHLVEGQYEINIEWPEFTMQYRGPREAYPGILDCRLTVKGLPDLRKVEPELDESCTENIHLSVTINQESELPNDHLSVSNIAAIRSFLSSCSHGSGQHYACAGTAATYAPSRLIDISGDSSTVRLVQTTNLGPDIIYATLSYCWGKPRADSVSYQTTASNLQERLISFDLTYQPPTIQDAVKVARTLYIQYLWIDALCILQGDTADWEQEGSFMDRIYRNSHLTIIPMATDNVWKPFLAKETLHVRLSLQLSEGMAPFQVTILHPWKRDFRAVLGPVAKASALKYTLPWLGRAWTLQEQLLSSRLLYFTREFCFMNCQSDQTMDNETVKLPLDFLPKPLGTSSGRNDADPIDDDIARSRLYDQWYKIAEQYSSRSLTFQRDRPIAIVGLANHFSSHLTNSGHYVFGLFSSNLHVGLLWVPCGGNSEWGPERKLASIPSWSWLSHPRQIAYPHPVKGVPRGLMVTERRTASGLGYVCCWRDGRLVISASVAALRDVIGESRLVGPIESAQWNGNFGCCNWGGCKHGGDWKELLQDYEETLNLSHVYLLLVAYPLPNAGLRYSWRILIVPTALSNTYRRVGAFALGCFTCSDELRDEKRQIITLV